ncbi:MAG: hypothetical protein QOG03_982 [Actinomycetota bacterium]|jgi:hypothetical protein|nr:hypothetical protein [Actinomycetota bacterium]
MSEADLTSATSTARQGLGLGVERPATAWLLAGVVVAGVAFERGLVSGVATTGGALAAVVAVAVLLASGRVVQPQARLVAAFVPIFALFLPLRMSPWLIAPDLCALAALLVVAASFGRDGDLFDVTIPRALTRAMHTAANGLAAPAFVAGPLARALRRRRDQADDRASLAGPMVRGVLLAVPLLLVLGALLASADAVFASLFRIPAPPGEVVMHAVVIAIGAWAMGGLLRTASASQPAGITLDNPPRLGELEVTVVLGALATLFGIFASVQAVTALGGAHHVLTTRGLTYADYARSGFFQLLAVSAITLVALLVLRATTEPSRRITVLCQVVVALTLVIVAVAFRRLSLYEHVFGFTMLRLYSQVAAVWIGLVFIALGLHIAGVGRPRNWVPTVSVMVGLALLLGLNVANPEAVVVRHNIAHAKATGRFDPGYFDQLSDDAIPTLVHAITGATDPELQITLNCDEPPLGRGWASYNRSQRAARAARATLCP